MKSIAAKSINELESRSPQPPKYDSYVESTRHRLRAKPIGSFTVEELRFMIGQRVGVQWLLPLALERLELDALSEGDMYPGDLLSAVLGLGAAHWAACPQLRVRVGAILESLHSIPEEVADAAAEFRRIV